MASTAGRLFFGKMADLSCVNRIRMYQLGVFVIGICSFLVPLATGYVGLTAYAVTFGFFEACYVLLIPLVTNDIVGPHKMSYALGSAFTVMAFPMFLGPPIAGLYTFSYKKKAFWQLFHAWEQLGLQKIATRGSASSCSNTEKNSRHFRDSTTGFPMK